MQFSSRQILHVCQQAREGKKVLICTATQIGADVWKKEIDRLFGKNCWPIGLMIRVVEPVANPIGQRGFDATYYDDIG